MQALCNTCHFLCSVSHTCLVMPSRFGATFSTSKCSPEVSKLHLNSLISAYQTSYYFSMAHSKLMLHWQGFIFFFEPTMSFLITMMFLFLVYTEIAPYRCTVCLCKCLTFVMLSTPSLSSFFPALGWLLKQPHLNVYVHC